MKSLTVLPESLPSHSTSCHGPESQLAWPVRSADAPVGSETPGFQQRTQAGSGEPENPAETDDDILKYIFVELLFTRLHFLFL